MFPKGSFVMVSATASLLVSSGPALYWKLSTVCQVCAKAALANRASAPARAGVKKSVWSVERVSVGRWTAGAWGAPDGRCDERIVFIMFDRCFSLHLYMRQRGAKTIRGVKIFWPPTLWIGRGLTDCPPKS